MGSKKHVTSDRSARRRRGGASARIGTPQSLRNRVPAHQGTFTPSDQWCEGCNRYHDLRAACVDSDTSGGDGRSGQEDNFREQHQDELEGEDESDKWNDGTFPKGVGKNEENHLEQVQSEDGYPLDVASTEMNWSCWSSDSALPQPPVVLGASYTVQSGPRRDIPSMLGEVFLIGREYTAPANGPDSAGLPVPGPDVDGDDEQAMPAPDYPYPAFMEQPSDESVCVASLEGIDNEDVAKTGTWV